MRYIVALKHDLSLRRNWIGESFQHIDHKCSRETLILQCGEFSLVRILSELIPSEVEEIFFGSYFRYFELDFLSF